MPIPKPRTGESEDAFTGRCMKAMEGEDKPLDQKLAICLDTWRKSLKSAVIVKVRKGVAMMKEVLESATIAGTTTLEQEHWHTYELDAQGDGVTINARPEQVEQHIHLIEDFKVKTENGHKHDLP